MLGYLLRLPGSAAFLEDQCGTRTVILDVMAGRSGQNKGASDELLLCPSVATPLVLGEEADEAARVWAAALIPNHLPASCRDL